MPFLLRLKTSLLYGFAAIVLAASSAAALAQQAPQADVQELQAVVVTGTRVTGRTAADSAAPISVIGAKALSQIGQPSLLSALPQLLPSFNVESHGYDTGNLTLSATLRGLSPNDTLVLVNGKRRHITGNLTADSGQYQGADTVDLSLIPAAAIDHIEVLQDGAAAVYGSDAIAGVINIILKHNSAGGTISGMGGQYYPGDGDTSDFSVNKGFNLGGKGFVSISAERRSSGITQRAGPFDKVATASGAPLPGLPFDATAIPGFPRTTVTGNPESQLTTVFYNSGYHVMPELTLYSSGSYAHRNAVADETYRAPNQAGFIALQNSNQQYLPPGSANPGCGKGVVPTTGINPCYGVIPSGSYTTPGELIYSTTGFLPKEELDEDDYSYTLGAKGDLAGWRWDLAGTYGKDVDKISTTNSGNGSLFVLTHFTPANFYDGSFIASELTGNLDVTKDFKVGLAAPLNFAFGFEGRKDTYAITQGDADSYFGIGAASYPGFGPLNAVSRSRNNYAEYVDLSVFPIQSLQVDVAGRHEHYTDFGDATVGKITARYDFTPALAIRGTVANGFRAPTLQEEYYTQTFVSQTSTYVTLGPNSAAAKAEDISPLGPEKSVQYSVGLVAHLGDNLFATLDGYSIAMSHRIIGTGKAPCLSNGVIVSPVVCDALAVSGTVIDPSVTNTGTTVFTNGADTLTRGVNLTVDYTSDFGNRGTVVWTGSGNWNKTTISSLAPNPAPLAGITLQTPSSTAGITSNWPKFKFVLGALWNLNSLTVDLREEIYGPAVDYVTPGTGGTAALPVAYVVNGANYYKTEVPPAGITNLTISYAFTQHFSVTVGADNLFNKLPPTMGYQSNGKPLNGDSTYDNGLLQSPYGINGGFYFGRLDIQW